MFTHSDPVPTMKLQQILPFIAALTSLMSLAAEATKRTWDFEHDEPGKIAKGFTNEVGRWEVANDGGNHVLHQKAKNEDAIFNLALVEGTSYKDIDLSVRLTGRRRRSRSRRRPGLASKGCEELLHRPLQPAGRQFPRLQGARRQAHPVPISQDSRRREVAHATCDDVRGEDHLLPRRPEASGGRRLDVPRGGARSACGPRPTRSRISMT